MDVSLSQLRVFLAVLEAGNLSRAADTLNISQAAVSAALKRLEADLSLILFRRGRFGAVPTRAAQRLEPHARRLLQLETSFLQTASSLRGDLSGTVRVASFQTLSRLVVPRLMQRLGACYPGVRLELDEHHAYAQSIRDALLTGACDLGFINHGFIKHGADYKADDKLRSWFLLEDSLVVLAPRGVAAKTWEAMLAYPLVGYQYHEDGCSLGLDYVRDTFGKSPTYQAKETTTVVGMVAQGMGFTVLPELSVGTLSDTITVVLLEIPLKRRVYAAVGPESLRLPTVRAALSTLRDLLPESHLPPLSVLPD